jgi:hypothetical protein
MLDLRDVIWPLLVDGGGLNTSLPPVARARPSSPSTVRRRLELYDLDEEMVCNVVGGNAPGPSRGKPAIPMSTLSRWCRGEMKDDRRERTAAMSRPAGRTWWGYP